MPNTKVVGIIFPYILTPIPNLYDHSFPRYDQITFLTFRRPTTLTFDLKFWKYLSVTVYPYVICMPSFIMIGWEMAEILHFEILRKHGQTNTHTNKHTNKQTWALQYLALPLRGRGNYTFITFPLINELFTHKISIQNRYNVRKVIFTFNKIYKMSCQSLHSFIVQCMRGDDIWRRVDQLNFIIGYELTSWFWRGDELTCRPHLRRYDTEVII